MADFHFKGPVKLAYGGVDIGTGDSITVESKVIVCPVNCRCEYRPLYRTEAGQMILQIRTIRFPKNRAGQLGNKCVKALERLR